MVQFASYLNRSLTDEYSPVFEIIYITEAIILAIIVFFLPLVAWIAVNGVPLHRNLRFFIAFAIFIGWIGVISRGILLAGQSFSTCSNEWNALIGGASFFRRFFFIYYGIQFFGITVERFVATLWWEWYEKQGSDTLAVLLGITIVLQLVSALFAYSETFGLTGKSEYTAIVFILFGIVTMAGGLLYLLLLIFNMREVTKLSRHGADQYSLSRSYQLRENVVVMKLLLRSATPLSIICTPVFLFLGGYIFLPSEYKLSRLFLMALFDLWAGVITIITSLVFPLVEQRFRRPAFTLRIYRLLIPTRFQYTNNNSRKKLPFCKFLVGNARWEGTRKRGGGMERDRRQEMGTHVE